MATVKLKFRPSMVIDRPGSIIYLIICHRISRQITTKYKIFPHEWDENRSMIVSDPCTSISNERIDAIRQIAYYLHKDMERLNMIISTLKKKNMVFTADDIVSEFHGALKKQSFKLFMEEIIIQLKRLKKERTMETYTTALNSFMRFLKDDDILLDEINSNVMMEYEVWLKSQGVQMNTVSFYNRILRATYNRAVEKELTTQRYPFKYVYTGIAKTIKRSIPLKYIKRIKELDLTLKPSLDFARDMFLFSFYMRGMSFVDMAYLKKCDLQNGCLSYQRQKTGRQLSIKWEKCMQDIINKYPMYNTPYLLPIIKESNGNERQQYRNALRLVNNKLKEITALIGLQTNLTMYVSRHSWASIAKSHNIPLSIISESMGHVSETTTLIYLSSLDCSMIDKANSLILGKL